MSEQGTRAELVGIIENTLEAARDEPQFSEREHALMAVEAIWQTWLAAHDREVEVRTLRVAAAEFDAVAYRMPATWLADRANRIESQETP